jgi:ribosome-associated translation inhibitor RaiA
MEVLVRGKSILISDAVRSFAEGKVRAALDHQAAKVSSVDVRVADLNGPRGGVDIRAGIVAVLVHGGAVFVEARAADAYVAIERAIARLVARTHRHGARLAAGA